MATLETIQNILNENLDIAPEKVNLDSTFDSLDIDSLDMVELICSLEDELDIEFGEPEGLNTVGELIKYVDSL
ncbi:MAG: acyl carrier protein [Coriobacteriia bacterium]|nr:acyl carrier protein [Coriobacteriia bacterium]